MDLTDPRIVEAMTPAERSTAFDEAVTAPDALPARYRAVLDAQDSEVRSLTRKAS
jgi:hypothetical protein